MIDPPEFDDLRAKLGEGGWALIPADQLEYLAEDSLSYATILWDDADWDPKLVASLACALLALYRSGDHALLRRAHHWGEELNPELTARVMDAAGIEVRA